MSRKHECYSNYMQRYGALKKRRIEAMPYGSEANVAAHHAYLTAYEQGHADAIDMEATGEYPRLESADPPAPSIPEWLQYKDGMVLEAIKAYRTRTGRGLTESCVAFGHNLK